MEEPERQEKVGPHGAPNLQQDQVCFVSHGRKRVLLLAEL